MIDIVEDPPERRIIEELQNLYVWMRPMGVRNVAELQGKYEWYNLYGKGQQKSDTETLEFFLLDQLARKNLSAKQQNICNYLVHSLNNRGRLQEEDLLYLQHQIGVSEGDIQDAVQELQKLEPAGVGARSLQESLCLQMKRLKGDHALELEILEKCFDLFSTNKYRQIAKKLGCTLNQVENSADTIRSLDPNPVSIFSAPEQIHYLCPDAFVIVADEHCEVVFNDIYQPQITINQYYMKMIKETDDKEVQFYLREKVRRAYELREGLLQRKTTLHTCVREIVEIQKNFFLSQTHPLKPLTRRELAEKVGFHESTVSRAVRGKYLQTQFGTFSLESFFTRGLGGDEASSADIKKQIRNLVGKESAQKPLSDQKLVELLSQQGIHISRRTVAKYRMELRIPGSSERRRKTKQT